MGLLNQLIGFFHYLVDRIFTYTKLLQNREVGWQTLNRKNGQYQREMQPLFKKLKLLFLFNPIMERLDSTHLMRLWIHDKTVDAGTKEGTAKSATQIKSFVDFYGINMNEFEPSDIHAFHSFEDFFVRQHKPGSRPIHAENDNTKAVVCADSRVVVYPSVEMTRALWIKGNNFTIENLLLDSKWAEKWKDGAVASFRLSPQDYHRYHSPVAGRIAWYKQISGDYYQVDPLCLQSDVDILTRNARCCIAIQTREFGYVLFVAIGATEVGSVKIRKEMQEAGTMVEKGEELGLFQFGGSSIIVAFEKGRIAFDEDLESVSRRKVMMAVEMGMSLGAARGRTESQGMEIL